MYRQEHTHTYMQMSRMCVCAPMVGILYGRDVLPIILTFNDGIDSFVDQIMIQTYINVAYICI